MKARTPPASRTHNKPGGRARVGRPPSVSVQAIIRATLEIGLDNVTLKKVADRLNVAVATLYRHVDGRDELVRLAAFQLAMARQELDDSAGHWAELAFHYARNLFDTFFAEPQLFAELMKGELGPGIEIEFLDGFLAALQRHGFSLSEGVRLHRAVAMLAIGAAVGATAVRAGTSKGKPPGLAVQQALDAHSEEELPHLRSALSEYLNVGGNHRHWLPALHALLAGCAAERGEVLPDTITAKFFQEEMS